MQVFLVLIHITINRRKEFHSVDAYASHEGKKKTTKKQKSPACVAVSKRPEDVANLTQNSNIRTMFLVKISTGASWPEAAVMAECTRSASTPLLWQKNDLWPFLISNVLYVWNNFTQAALHSFFWGSKYTELLGACKHSQLCRVLPIYVHMNAAAARRLHCILC